MTVESLTGSQVLAARALIGIGQAKLAARACVDIQWLKDLEASGWEPVQASEALDALGVALEALGAVFIEEADGGGAGVRLKFSRAQARAIGRWEGEGGLSADDEVP